MFKDSKKFRLSMNMTLQINNTLFKITSADREPDWNR